MSLKNNKYFKLGILILVAETIYLNAYLRWSFYDPLMAALDLNNAQFGTLASVYGISSMLFYAPGGWLADRFSARKTLFWGFLCTGILGLYFATFPSYSALLFIHFAWGVLATLTFWAALMKATRGLGNSSEQGKLFGFLEGGRGMMGALYSFLALGLFGVFGESVLGLRWIIVAYSILPIIGAFLVWFTLDDQNDTSNPDDRIRLQDITMVLKMPAVWLISLIVLSCYSVYMGSTYLTPYFTTVLGASVTLAGFLAIVRNYVLMLIGGPAGGYIADKTGSISRVILICFILMVISLALFAFLPPSTSMIFMMVGVMIMLSASMFGMRGIYFATIDEVNIPQRVTGTAIGIISVIGFFPEVYMNILAGNLLDKFQGFQGYQMIFLVMLGFAVLGFLSTVLLSRITKKNQQLLRQKDYVREF